MRVVTSGSYNLSIATRHQLLDTHAQPSQCVGRAVETEAPSDVMAAGVSVSVVGGASSAGEKM